MARSKLIERTQASVSCLARSFQQLMREQLSCGPITVQQCYTLAALTEGPRTMKLLAADVGQHQSTLTRVVEKLERLQFVKRERDEADQRTVHVILTDAGRETHAQLDGESKRMIGVLLDSIPKKEQGAIVAGLEALARILDPHCDTFRRLLGECCNPSGAGSTPGAPR